MAQKRIPVEALIVLQNNLDALPVRSPQRKALVAETAALYNVSIPTVRRALRKHHQPRAVQRSDYNRPRVTSQTEMKRYCELIAAVKSRSTNRKGHHLSTEICIHLLEEHGVETPDGLVRAPQGLLKRSTVGRYLSRWGYDNRTLSIEPPATRFQAIHSNDCWQFDFSQSDLKKLKTDALGTLMLASVVDDRSGMCYQEYHYVQGEDAMTALRFLFNAMAPKVHKNCPFQGIPGMLYLDNGPVAKSRVFKQVMKHLNVEVRVHMPKGSDGRRTTARSKGKVERVFRTVKESLETLYHFHTPDNLDEANEWLRQYLVRYNAMPHRTEEHSRLEDWLKQLPPEGFRAMCSWERFCTFAREPEQRKADADGCVNVNGVRFQLSLEMAGQEVTLLWGLFDHELFVEFGGERHGPFYPVEDPVPLNTFRKRKKSRREQRADRIEALAKAISIPRAALAGGSESTKTLLAAAQMTQLETPASIPFEVHHPAEQKAYKNNIEAKLAIAQLVGHPLARLTSTQMDEVNRILDTTLDKKTVLAQIRAYFSMGLHDQTGDAPCMEK